MNTKEQPIKPIIMETLVFKRFVLFFLFISTSIIAQKKQKNNNDSGDMGNSITITVINNDVKNLNLSKTVFKTIKKLVPGASDLLDPSEIGSPEHNRQVEKEIANRRKNSLEQQSKDKYRQAKIQNESDNAEFKRREIIKQEKARAAKRARADEATRILRERAKARKRAKVRRERDRGVSRSRAREVEREVRSRSPERNERDSREFDRRYRQG